MQQSLREWWIVVLGRFLPFQGQSFGLVVWTSIHQIPFKQFQVWLGDLYTDDADIVNSIGRITEGLLLGLAETVDIVEPISKFSDALKNKPVIGVIYNVGLESWSPPSSTKYDLIWNQWCLGHLTDAQLIEYLKKCGKALKDGGMVVVKENLSTRGEDIFDELDSSVTRCDEKLRDIFEKAGLRIKKTEIQKGLPKELYPVRIYALVPKV